MQGAQFLSAGQLLLTTLVVKLAVMAALATMLVRYRRFRHILIFERRGWRHTTGSDDLKMLAVSRLLLDNVPNIKAYWIMMGMPLAAVALHFGANDVQGTVVAVHSGWLYRVQCDQGHEVLAQLSGRMRRFRIKVVPGDRVTVGVSPYDPVRGIITFRAR